MVADDWIKKMGAHAKFDTGGENGGDERQSRHWGPLSPLYRVSKRAGIAILNGGIHGLVVARDALLSGPGEPQNSSEVREGSEKPVRTSEERLHKGELPSGTYTRDTLPPPSPAVQAILDRARAGGRRLAEERAANEGSPSVGSGKIKLTDKPRPGLHLTDKPKPGIKIL